MARAFLRRQRETVVTHTGVFWTPVPPEAYLSNGELRQVAQLMLPRIEDDELVVLHA